MVNRVYLGSKWVNAAVDPSIIVDQPKANVSATGETFWLATAASLPSHRHVIIIISAKYWLLFQLTVANADTGVRKRCFAVCFVNDIFAAAKTIINR